MNEIWTERVLGSPGVFISDKATYLTDSLLSACLLVSPDFGADTRHGRIHRK